MMKVLGTRGVVVLALAAVLAVGAGIVIAQQPPIQPPPPMGAPGVGPGPMMGMAMGSPGVAMAVQDGYVYVVVGATLHKVDANTLEVVGTQVLVSPMPGPGGGGLLMPSTSAPRLD